MRCQLDFIKQEHRVFSAYLKTSFPDKTDEIASSLVYGGDFIHVYAFSLCVEPWPIVLHTYSKHGNACFRSKKPIFSDDLNDIKTYLIVRLTQFMIRIIHILKLQLLEKLLAKDHFIDHFIKYGLQV